MSHPNATLTPRHRLKVARLVVDDGWPISEVAARFQVSWPTVKRWVDRYLAGESMQDRSSRPRRSPTKTPKAVTKRCVSQPAAASARGAGPARRETRHRPIDGAPNPTIGPIEPTRLRRSRDWRTRPAVRA